MRTDRRAWTLLAVILLAIVIIPQLRSYANMGAVLFTSAPTGNSITLSGTSLITVGEDPNNQSTLSSWSVSSHPDFKPSSRDEEVGLILTHIAYRNSGPLSKPEDVERRIHELYQYCETHPEDLAAKGHLLRLGVQAPSTAIAAPAFLPLVEKLLVIANATAKADPSNWYWRDRVVHFSSVLGKRQDGLQKFVAKPFPTLYEDYTGDEEAARNAAMRAMNRNLPKAILVPEWAGILFPHFMSAAVYLDEVRKDTKNSALRAATIECGKCMMHSKDSWIGKIIGLRMVKTGVWTSVANDRPDRKKLNSEHAEELKPAYVKEFGQANWKWALDKAEQNMGFASPTDPDFMPVRLGHLGPFFTAGGIAGILASMGIYLISKRRKKAVPTHWLVFPGLWVASTVLAACWGDWRYLVNFTLGSAYLNIPYVLLGVWVAIRTLRSDDKAKFLKFAATLIMGVIGFCWPPIQAVTMMMFLILLVQRWSLPLRPWLAVLIITLLGYHTAMQLAFSSTGFFAVALLALVSIAILAFTKFEFDPDQARIGSAFIPVGFLLLGLFLTAQYDRALVGVREQYTQWETEHASAFQ